MALFGLEVSEFTAILAVCVAGVSSTLTAITFLKTYSRNRKSEQIKIVRDIQDNINIGRRDYYKFFNNKEYPNEGSIEDKAKWVEGFYWILSTYVGPIRYFTFLVDQGEIDDTGVLKYYGEGIPDHLNRIDYSLGSLEEVIKSDNVIREKVETSSGIRQISLDNFRRVISHSKKVWEHK